MARLVHPGRSARAGIQHASRRRCVVVITPAVELEKKCYLLDWGCCRIGVIHGADDAARRADMIRRNAETTRNAQARKKNGERGLVVVVVVVVKKRRPSG